MEFMETICETYPPRGYLQSVAKKITYAAVSHIRCSQNYKINSGLRSLTPFILIFANYE